MLRLFKYSVFLLLSVGLMGSSCTSSQRVEEILAPSGQLRYRAGMFNKYLRWKAYRRAKLLVMPKLRPAFALKWERERPHVRITSYSVRDITEVEKGKVAIVLVVIHRHRLPSVSVKRVLEQQRWESDKGYWFFVGLEKKKDAPAATPPKKRPVAR